MFKSLSPTYKGIFLALIGYSGFAISDTPAKFLTSHYSTLAIVFYIALTASIFILALSPLLGGFKKPDKGSIRFHVLRGVMNLSLSLLVVESLSHLPLATVYTIIFAKPFIAAILGMIIYHEFVTRQRWTAIALGFAGIVIAMRPSADGIDPALLLPLGAATCSAIMWVSTRSLKGESSFAMGFYAVLVTALVSLPFLLHDFVIPAPEHLYLFAISGAGVSAGVIGLSLAFQNAPSAAVSPFHYTQMLWGISLGYLVFGDVPDALTMLGAAIIISSGLYLIWARSRERP